jgi:hypothetical protein
VVLVVFVVFRAPVLVEISLIIENVVFVEAFPNTAMPPESLLAGVSCFVMPSRPAGIVVVAAVVVAVAAAVLEDVEVLTRRIRLRTDVLHRTRRECCIGLAEASLHDRWDRLRIGPYGGECARALPAKRASFDGAKRRAERRGGAGSSRD